MRQKIESASSASHTSLGADAAEKNGRWLVGGVLGDQAALEGALEDGLAEAEGADSSLDQRGLNGLGMRGQVTNECHYGQSLPLGRQRKRKRQDHSLTNCVLTGRRHFGPLHM